MSADSAKPVPKIFSIDRKACDNNLSSDRQFYMKTLGIDVGTEVTRVVVIHPSGDVVASARVGHASFVSTRTAGLTALS